MRQRYFIIEPKYSDPDTFCTFIVGSDRVRASIQIYADIEHFRRVADALGASNLHTACRPFDDGNLDSGNVFGFELSVLPHDGGEKILEFMVFQEWLDDGAPYRANIRFKLTPKEAKEISAELEAWCEKPVYAFIWKGD